MLTGSPRRGAWRALVAAVITSCVYAVVIHSLLIKTEVKHINFKILFAFQMYSVFKMIYCCFGFILGYVKDR